MTDQPELVVAIGIGLLTSAAHYAVAFGIISTVLLVVFRRRLRRAKRRSIWPPILVSASAGLVSGFMFFHVYLILSLNNFLSFGDVRTLGLASPYSVAPAILVVFAIHAAFGNGRYRRNLFVGAIGGAVLIAVWFMWMPPSGTTISEWSSPLTSTVFAAAAVLVTYPLAAYFLSPERKNPAGTEKEVLAYLRSHNYDISVTECADELGATKDAVSIAIATLEHKGLLRTEG